MKRLLLYMGIACVALVVTILAAAAVLASSYSSKVLVVTPAAPEAVALNKMLWVEGDEVAEIYGVPSGEPQMILFADPARMIRPEEDPSLTLYRVTKEAGENPLQEKTMWFFVRLAVIGLSVMGTACFAGYALWRRPS